MFWLFDAPRRLRELGILGINARNAAYILDQNPRALFPLVDDKLLMRDLCVRIGVPTPKIYSVIAYPWMLRQLWKTLGDLHDFVVKPNHGSAGRGVLVIVRPGRSYYIRHHGAPPALEGFPPHPFPSPSRLLSL